MKQSQGLIITLIIFIILTLGLGVLSYFMGQGYKETATKLKDAESKAKQGEDSVRSLTSDLEKIKSKVGYEMKEMDKVLKEMQNDIEMATGKLGSTSNYKDSLRGLFKNMSERNKERSDFEKSNAQYKQIMLNEVAKTEAQKATFEQQRKDADVAYQTQKTGDKKLLDEWENNYKALTQKVDTVEQEAKALNEKYRVEAADAKEVAAKIAGINTNLSIKIDQLSQADFEIPDGKILYVDQHEKTVNLNIGKMDGVRVLTKFGVFPHNSLDLGRAIPKGSIEIIRVTGDHESVGKILEDELIDPILPNDMIYTPLWKVGEKVQYALGYRLDINGDGKSDIDYLKNLINASDAYVACWIDDEGNVHGKMTPDITAFVISDKSINTILDNESRNQKDKTAIYTKFMTLVDEAQKNNIKEMKLPEFLRRIHYRKTADIAKFQEMNGADQMIGTGSSTTVSETPVAPIYVNKEHATPVSSLGKTSPLYSSEKSQPAPGTTGRVSDYYFRKRTP